MSRVMSTIVSTPETSPALPLSCSQRELALAQLLAPGAPHLNVATYWRVAGEIDLHRFAVALSEATSRCDGLRMVLRSHGGLAEQHVLPEAQVPLECIECDTPEEAMKWGTDCLARPYELFESPLYRFGIARVRGDHTCLFIGCHHTMGDGWSLQVALQRISESYNASLCGGKAPDPPQFREFLTKEQSYLSSSAHARDRRFWEGHLSPPPAPPFAPRVGADRPPFGLPDTGVSLELEPDVYERLVAQSKAAEATETSGIIAALYAFLCRYFGLEDLMICTALLNRPTARDREILGPLFGRALVRLRGGAGQPFAALIRQARDEARQVYRHHRFPLSGLADILGGSYSREWPRVASVTFSMIPYIEARISFGDAHVLGVIDRIHCGYEPSPIHVSLRRPSDRAAPVLDFICNSYWLDTHVALDLPKRFVSFLGNLVRSSASSGASVSMLTSEERERVVEHWNRTELTHAEAPLFHAAVSKRAVHAPEAIALDFDGTTLTYAELDRRSNQLAHHLRGLGTGAGSLVGLYLERGFDSIIGLLAVLKAGAAYLPLDADLPAPRLAYLCQDARLSLVLTQSELAGMLAGFCGRVLALDTEADTIAREPIDALAPTAGADQQLAYVIYTSGSTGLPKGVMLQHRGLRNLVEAQVAAFAVKPGDRVLQFARLSFDASIWEIGMALRAGATLCLMRSAADLADVMSRRKISVATLPPSALTLLDRMALPHLRTLILAGEPCSGEQVAAWLKRCEVINAYGPTEVTVCASFHRCRPGEVPPIGRPLENTKLYVLDEELEPVPAGVSGELYVAGDGLARGYLNRPALTAQRFIASPFVPGERLYRTGDRARYREDGCLQFLGRTDHQVKVRGHRVEPGEIESALMAYGSIEQAVVVACTHAGSGETRLNAYLVPRGAEELNPSRVRSYLRERLPEYMIPAVVATVDRIPLTANGKIDRQALAALEPRLASGEYSAPQTPTEQLLAAVWQEALAVDHVSLDANFFDLGGSSLSLIKARTLLAERAGREIQITDFFAHPTLRRLAQHLDGSSPDTGALERLAAAGRLRMQRAELRGRARTPRAAISNGVIP